MTKIVVLSDSDTERFKLVKRLKDFSSLEIAQASGADELGGACQESDDLIIFMDLIEKNIEIISQYKKVISEDSTVIYLTSNDTTDNRNWAESLGSKAYVIKPIKEDTLYSIFRLFKEMATE